MRLIPWSITVLGAIWTAGNSLLVVVAVAIFAWAPPHGDLVTRAAAGAIFGTALARWSAIVSFLLIPLLIALGWLAGTALREQRKNAALIWLLVMSCSWGTHAVNQDSVTQVNQLAAEIRTEQAKPAGTSTTLHDLEVHFADLHAASTRWHAVETLVALGLLIGGSVILLRQPRPQPLTAPSPALSAA
jgi:hypothetical protein